MPLGTIRVRRPGLCRFMQGFPQGAIFGSVALSVPTQVRPWAMWSDGSLKLARLTADVPTVGTYPLVVGEAAQGQLPQADPPPFAVTVWVDGSVYRTPDLSADANVWEVAEDGPLCAEGRVRLPLVDAAGDSHPFLSVLLDLRQYRRGRWAFDVSVENCYRSAGAAVTCDVSVTIGGRAVFDREGAVLPYLRRWRRVFHADKRGRAWTPGLAVPDCELLAQAGYLPRYSPDVANMVEPTPVFDLMDGGGIDPNMPAHGGRPELAPLPDWQARAIVHGELVQVETMLARAQQSGAWPIHVLEDDGALVSIDARPNEWLDPRAAPEYRPVPDLGECAYFDETRPDNPPYALIPDVAHQPSLCYVPWLFTGDRYFADETAGWGNYTLLATFQEPYYNARGGSLGLLAPNQVRGIGWGLRSLVQAWAVLPDGAPLKEYFRAKVQNNLEWLESLVSQEQAPAFFPFARPENQDPQYNARVWISFWERNYLGWAIDYAHKHGFTGAETFLVRNAALQMALFNDPATRDGAADYIVPIGDRDQATGTVTWYTDYRQSYLGPQPIEGYYGVDARLMLIMGIAKSWRGAAEALTWLEPQMGEDIATRSGWSLARIDPG